MQKLDAKDYKSDVKPIWCPGCGDFGVLNGLTRAFSDLEIKPENITIASGIGCSSRTPAFLNTYGIHGVHGRALPLATGIKLGNPETTVVAVGGDGDGFSIGGGHIPHAARRNVDLTYIVMDNSIYGMTKGQPSPTSPEGIVRKAAPYGAQERPLNPILMVLAYGAPFVARAFTGKFKELVEVFKQAITYPGFAFVQVLSPCVTFNNTYEQYRTITETLPENHDPADLTQAIHLALETEKLYLGVFYRDPEIRPAYSARISKMQAQAPPLSLETIFSGFRR